MVKELVSVGFKQEVSGNGYFMGDYVGLEATIKSSEHFPDEPGNWAYFSFGHELPLANYAEEFPTAACNSCHEVAAGDTDFVFEKHYPVLRARAVDAGPGNADLMNADAKKNLESAMGAATEKVKAGE